MKHLYLLYFTLLSLCVFAQKKEAHAIQIQLEDAETGKNISDAKVTLEGFEIPALTAKYDKQENVYYFTAIPKGYNTIMAYHKNYNEKGFQNIESLPKELKLKLYTLYRVHIPNDNFYTRYNEDITRNIDDINYYKEDNNRLYLLFNDTILNSVSKCEYDSKSLCFARKYITQHYPELTIKDELKFSYYEGSVIMVEKRKQKKFKRFNDPVIKRLTEDKNIIAINGMLMITKDKEKTYFDQEGNQNYIPKYIKYINCNPRPRGEINKPNLSDYNKKLKKNLLKNDVYKRNKKELDLLFKIYQSKINKGELLDDFYNFDTIEKRCSRGWPIDQIITNNGHPQYIAISNILDYDEIRQEPYTNEAFKNKTIYRIYYGENDLINYKKLNSVVESVKKSNDKTIFFYRLKNNIASPFGMADLIEYYNLYNRKNIIQKIENP